MTFARPTRGYALNLTGIVCAGALACGDGRSAGDDTTTAVTGYPLDTTESDESDSDDGSSSLDCNNHGWVCGEFLICACAGDIIPESCGCEPVLCTEDAHCEADQTCLSISGGDLPQRDCAPDYCDTSLQFMMVTGDDPPPSETCVDTLHIGVTTWTDTAGFEGLRHIHTELGLFNNPELTNLDGFINLESSRLLQIEGNAALTSIDGLANIAAISSGTIINNPLLPTADVEALLAQIPGGDAVVVCGNLDGDPC